MSHRILGATLAPIVAFILLNACQPIGAPLPTPAPVLVPVTVEVTRILPFTQTVILPMTPAPAVPCAPTQREQASEIVVGAVVPFSLPGAFVAGFAMQTALNIAVAEINSTGGIDGIPLRLVTYDSAISPELGLTAVDRLVTQDCAVAILGLYHSEVASAVVERAHSYDVPVLIAEARADELTATGYPEVFRLAPAESTLAAMPANWLAQVGDFNGDGQMSAVLVADGAAQTAFQLEPVQRAFAGMGIESQVLTVDLPTDDFSPVIARVVMLDHLPDALFIFVPGEPAFSLQRQILAAGIGPTKGTLLVNNQAALDSARFWQYMPDGAGTVVMRNGPWYSTVTEQGRAFVGAYNQYMARWPEPYAFASYDSIYLLADALRRGTTLAGPEPRCRARNIRRCPCLRALLFPIYVPKPPARRVRSTLLVASVARYSHPLPPIYRTLAAFRRDARPLARSLPHGGRPCDPRHPSLSLTAAVISNSNSPLISFSWSPAILPTG